jgi:hypothetical protein
MRGGVGETVCELVVSVAVDGALQQPADDERVRRCPVPGAELAGAAALPSDRCAWLGAPEHLGAEHPDEGYEHEVEDH